MNNINVINKLKSKLKEVKPTKDKYGTKTKYLDSRDYVLYAILKGKRNPEKCCHSIEKFNDTLSDLRYILLFAIKNKDNNKINLNARYSVLNFISEDELVETFNLIEAYTLNSQELCHVQ